MFNTKIRRNDEVVVIYGASKGKKGKVLEVLRKKNCVIVKDINIVHRHRKPSGKVPGGIIKKESPIHLSNVSLIDPKNDKPTKVGYRFDNEGSKIRYAKLSGEDCK